MTAATTEPRDAREAANYVAALTAELSMLAYHCGLEALAFILEMARLEAENIHQMKGLGARLAD